MNNATYWISHLHLQPHPEGGFFREVFRSSVDVPKSDLPVGFKSSRRLATSIYYLLRSGEISKLHRLRSDELWYFHAGCPLKIMYIDQEGNRHSAILGSNPEKAEVLYFHVPAGNIFAAEVVDPETFSLVSCVVTPGFEFEDFEMFPKDDLLQAYPRLSEFIEKYG